MSQCHSSLRFLATAFLSISLLPLAHGADKYATYGALSVFGRIQGEIICGGGTGLVSARLAIPFVLGVGPTLLSITDVGSTHRFEFVAKSVFEFSALPASPATVLEAWRTYVPLPAGTHDFVAVQKLASGERLSDAIRVLVPSAPCLRLASVDVLDGDLQVSVVGSPFAAPNIRVKVVALGGGPAPMASVALGSEPILFETLDTAIDGPKTAQLTDTDGVTSFAVSPGSKAGIKRFIVKARHAGDFNAVSAMVTLAHAPVGAPVRDSVPIVEYQYDGGSGARSRYLTGAVAATNLLDSHDDSLFQRTGQVWRAFTSASAAPGLMPVCQFFGKPTAANAVTHFFTANAQECAALISAANGAGAGSPRLAYEGIAFYAVVPDEQQRCPSAFPIPVIRYFVASPSPHHLYLVGNVNTGEPVIGPSTYTQRDGTQFCTDVATAY